MIDGAGRVIEVLERMWFLRRNATLMITGPDKPKILK